MEYFGNYIQKVKVKEGNSLGTSLNIYLNIKMCNNPFATVFLSFSKYCLYWPATIKQSVKSLNFFITSLHLNMDMYMCMLSCGPIIHKH